jgi:choline dehydrogenase
MQHEDHWRGGDPMHAAPGFDVSGARAGGEWRVERQRLHWDILEAFAQAATEAGIPPTEDFNRGNNEGVGYFEVNQRKGVRWNASKAFLRPVVGRHNLQVWTGATVRRLLLATDADGALRADGVEIIPEGGGEPVKARCTGEVVLACGAVGTPAILQRSGIGPRALLEGLGITVQHALPGVGANLQDHLQIRAVFSVEGTRTLNTMTQSLWGKAAIGLEYLWRRSGPMSMAPSQLGAFWRSEPNLPWPNIQYHVQPLSLEAFGEPLHPFNAFTASVCNLNPESRGRVHITSPDPMAAPSILANYLSSPRDRQVAVDALRLTRRIASMPALARYQPREVKPGVQFESDEELARLAGDIGTTIFHPVGTCKMGAADDPLAVVDSRLRVKGVRGVRVADASIMPTITSGNTNSPTLMIAERAASWILASSGNP